MRFRSPRARGVLLSASLLLTLTGCGTMTASGVVTKASAFCLMAKPIYWSAADTDDTIRQAKTHNAVGKAVCGWGSEPKTTPAN